MVLTISPQSFNQFSSLAWDMFVGRLAEFLKANAPDFANKPLETLRPQVRLLAEEAHSFGLTSERSIAMYLITAYQLGKDFSRRFPGAAQILRSPISEDEKATLLEAFALNLLDTLER